MPSVMMSAGKVKMRAGKVRTGAAHDPCCCGCCECADVVDGLASSYMIDLSGTWDVAACNPYSSFCEGSVTSFQADQVLPGICLFGNDGLDPSQLCLSGYSVASILIGLNCNWFISVRFFEDGGGVAGALFTYRKRSATCDDPTGIYDLVDVDCPSTSAPLTITVT